MTSKEEVLEKIEKYDEKRVPSTLSLKGGLKKRFKLLCMENDMDMSDVIEYMMINQIEQENK